MPGGLGQPRQRQVEVQAAGHRLDAAPCQARTALPGHGPAGSGVRPRPLPPPYSEGLTLGSHEEQDLPGQLAPLPAPLPGAPGRAWREPWAAPRASGSPAQGGTQCPCVG